MNIQIDNTIYRINDEHFYRLYIALRKEWWIREMKEEYRALQDSRDKGEHAYDLHPMFFDQIAEYILTHCDSDLSSNAANDVIYRAADTVYKDFCIRKAERWISTDGQTSQYLRWMGGDRFEVYQYRSDIGDMGSVMYGEVKISEWEADVENVVRSLGYDTENMLYLAEKEKSLHLIAARIFELFCLNENSECAASGSYEYCRGFIAGKVD